MTELTFIRQAGEGTLVVEVATPCCVAIIVLMELDPAEAGSAGGPEGVDNAVGRRGTPGVFRIKESDSICDELEVNGRKLNPSSRV